MILRSLQWIMWKVGLASCLYLNVFQQAEWAGNIVLFIVWITFLCGLFFLIPEVREKVYLEQKKWRKRPIPMWLMSLWSLMFVICLAAIGWFWSAGAYLFSYLCVETFYSFVKEKEKDNV